MSIPLDLVTRFSVFYGIGSADLERLLEAGEEISAKDGEALFTEGDAAGKVFVLINGRIEVSIYPPESTDEMTIGKLGEGDVLGEACLLGKGRRTASATAIGNVLLLGWEGLELLDLLERNPAIGFHLMRNIASDLADRLEFADLSLRLR